MRTQKSIIVTACILGMLGVAIGAFGAHALKDLLVKNNRMDTYELAVRYHFYHALALLGMGALMKYEASKFLVWSARLMLSGTILFSGSLYVLAVFNTTKVAMITPLGGVLLIAGWASAGYGFLKAKD
jgi:uncharacterized membrane protein YgdD (TMEM256/DUF423 family)